MFLRPFFHIAGTEGYQTTEARGPQQNRKGTNWSLILDAGGCLFPLPCTPKNWHHLCTAVVWNSAGGRGEGQEENHSLAWSRRTKVDARDAEENRAHLLPAATPWSSVSCTHTIMLVENDSGYILVSSFLYWVNLQMFECWRWAMTFLKCFDVETQEGSFFLSCWFQKAKSCLPVSSRSLNTMLHSKS